MANNTREPTIGSITITGKDSLFWNSGDQRLLFSSSAPILKFKNEDVFPDAGFVTITGQTPVRGFGLITQGLAPTLGIDIVKYPGEGSVTITELDADRSVEAPPQQTRLVPIGGVALTGSTPDVGGRESRPTVGSLSVSGKQPIKSFNVIQIPDPEETPIGTFTTLYLSGAGEDQGPRLTPTVFITAIGGVAIENTNAVEDTKNRYNICDVSGFKAKPGELVRRWDGMWVLPEFNEPRNKQDFAYSRSEKQRGAKRPEPVGSETMISDLYPNGVTSDDL